jgi:hypothetical protein
VFVLFVFVLFVEFYLSIRCLICNAALYSIFIIIILYVEFTARFLTLLVLNVFYRLVHTRFFVFLALFADSDFKHLMYVVVANNGVRNVLIWSGCHLAVIFVRRVQLVTHF